MNKGLNYFANNVNINEIEAIQIKLASSEKIRSWSYGEVTKPETINYRTHKPEGGGLFCAAVFGPVTDYECLCGKYKRWKNRGIVCDKCGVEVTHSRVRRERMGVIELAAPVSHIWFFKGPPSRIGAMLNITNAQLERVLYFESYIVTDPMDTELEKGQLLKEEELRQAKEEYGDNSFVAVMGAEGIREILQQVEVQELAMELRTLMKVETSAQRREALAKRLTVVEGFLKSGAEPHWMILDVLPVIPTRASPIGCS